MAKDVNIHVKTEGTEQASQKLGQVGQAAKGIGDKTTEGTKKGAAGMDKLTQSTTTAHGRFRAFFSSIKSWVTGLVGITAVIAGITKAIRAQSDALREHAEIISEQQKRMLALQAMGEFFIEHPEARKEVAAYAEFGRRPFEQVAEAWYALESKGAGLTEAQKKGIMREALELGRMEPEADLKSIIDVFSLYAKETRQQDINQIQNVIRQTLSQAGAELSQMGQYLPRFLSLGVAGGLTGAETAGLWAFATTRAPTPEAATVGIRNIFAALRGKGTPESQQLLQSLGITPQMSIFEQLTALSQAQRAGRFGVPEAEAIAGRENIAVLLSMLTEPRAMMDVVRQVTRVARPDIDIVGERLQQIMSADEIARLEEERRRLDIAIKNIKGQDVRALEWDVYLKEYERRMREANVAEYAIRYQLWKYKIAAGLGREPGPFWLIESFGGVPSFPTQNEMAPVIINDNSIKNYPRTGEPVTGPRSAPEDIY